MVLGGFLGFNHEIINEVDHDECFHRVLLVLGFCHWEKKKIKFNFSFKKLAVCLLSFKRQESMNSFIIYNAKV